MTNVTLAWWHLDIEATRCAARHPGVRDCERCRRLGQALTLIAAEAPTPEECQALYRQGLGREGEAGREG